MTTAHRRPQFAAAYDDPAAPADLIADCRAAEARLAYPLRSPLHSVARAAARPAPSLRFEDFPHEVPKPQIHPAVAAQRISAALGLDI